ncbi:HD domain-containing protein [Clostridium sp. MSJ-4]|uniref:HD domain-containing protein n=1 Tax=Clostridium simiarum TaxID=2841506 RepID=A0ABS6F4F3_9CLOT|nr:MULTISPECIES: HD domain-containing protein [Clostridium]MBU5593397.1 HD domain-containing protein [Clostridium simiarum]
MFYRLKQFLWDITSPFKPIDDEFLNKYLDKKELEVFNELKPAEKHHCIRVAKDALNYINKENIKDTELDQCWFMKICLLHDIGKKFGSLSVIDRSLLVLINKVLKGNMCKYNSSKKVDLYYNHPIKGYIYLKSLNKYDDRFLYIIKNHHNYDIKGDKLLDILIYYDNLN